MFRKTLWDEWSNRETFDAAVLWNDDFKDLIRSNKHSFKSVKDVTESFRDHVYLHAVDMIQSDKNFLANLEKVNWAEIATTVVVNNPIWNDNYFDQVS